MECSTIWNSGTSGKNLQGPTYTRKLVHNLQKIISARKLLHTHTAIFLSNPRKTINYLKTNKSYKLTWTSPWKPFIYDWEHEKKRWATIFQITADKFFRSWHRSLHLVFLLYRECNVKCSASSDFNRTSGRNDKQMLGVWLLMIHNAAQYCKRTPNILLVL